MNDSFGLPKSFDPSGSYTPSVYFHLCIREPHMCLRSTRRLITNTLHVEIRLCPRVTVRHNSSRNSIPVYRDRSLLRKRLQSRHNRIEGPRGRKLRQQTRCDSFQETGLQKFDFWTDRMRGPQPGQQAVEVPPFSVGSPVDGHTRVNNNLLKLWGVDGLKSGGDPLNAQRVRWQSKFQFF